jgi:chemotaxis family two-component system response regulator Rcp1
MYRSSTRHPASILLVEDNPGDVRLTTEAMKEAGIKTCLHVVGDGAVALDFLYRRAPYETAPVPDLILLDLNLPKKDGREVLAEIKGHPTLRRIPTVVLTTSQAIEDIGRAYDLHVNCYITKPIDLERFIEVVRVIDSFWLTTVTLPMGEYV